mgnify:CR=1 FL=1
MKQKQKKKRKKIIIKKVPERTGDGSDKVVNHVGGHVFNFESLVVQLPKMVTPKNAQLHMQQVGNSIIINNKKLRLAENSPKAA